MRFVLPTNTALILGLGLTVCLLILPIANHIGIFIAIRRHNSQVAGAVSGQNLSVIFRREKKAAMDMLIVIAVLMFCLAPVIFVTMFRPLFYESDQFQALYAWSVALVYINSSINPGIYLVQNREIRSAVRSMMPFWSPICSTVLFVSKCCYIIYFILIIYTLFYSKNKLPCKICVSSRDIWSQVPDITQRSPPPPAPWVIFVELLYEKNVFLPASQSQKPCPFQTSL